MQERREVLLLRGTLRRHYVHGRDATQANVLHIQPRVSVRSSDGHRHPGVLPAAGERRESIVECHRAAGNDCLSAAYQHRYALSYCALSVWKKSPLSVHPIYRQFQLNPVSSKNAPVCSSLMSTVLLPPRE